MCGAGEKQVGLPKPAGVKAGGVDVKRPGCVAWLLIGQDGAGHVPRLRK